jgi:hypothetical protein
MRVCPSRRANDDVRVPLPQEAGQSRSETILHGKAGLVEDQRSDGRFAVSGQHAQRQRQLPSIGEQRGVKAQMPIRRVLLVRPRRGKGLPEFMRLETHAKSLIQ